jgi:hypothetical protein
MRKQLDHHWKQIDKFESSVKMYAETKAGWRQKFSAKEGELEVIKVVFYSHPLSVRCSCLFVVGDQCGYSSPINKPEMTRAEQWHGSVSPLCTSRECWPINMQNQNMQNQLVSAEKMARNGLRGSGRGVKRGLLSWRKTRSKKHPPRTDRAYVVTIGINARICAPELTMYIQFAACRAAVFVSRPTSRPFLPALGQFFM